MNAARISLVAVVLLTLAVAPGRGAFAQESGGSAWDGIYTKDQAERGREAYASGCAECHGAGLEGKDDAVALNSSDFRWDWNGLTVGDLYERIRVSMPDGKPRTMSDAQKVDVVAFILSQNGYPAGDDELPGRTSELNAWSILAVQP